MCEQTSGGELEMFTSEKMSRRKLIGWPDGEVTRPQTPREGVAEIFRRKQTGFKEYTHCFNLLVERLKYSCV